MSCGHHYSPPSYPNLNPTAGAKWIKHLTRDRLNNFEGGHFDDLNLSSALFIHKLDSTEHVKLQVWSAPGLSKPTFEEAMKQEFKETKKGQSFGPSCECFSSSESSVTTKPHGLQGYTLHNALM